MIRFIFFIAIIVLTIGLSSQVNTWTGSNNSQWNNRDNWSLSRVPLISDDVVISQVSINRFYWSGKAVLLIIYQLQAMRH
jgi:hypothetical protein